MRKRVVEINRYLLKWGGSIRDEIVEGESIHQAMTLAGYGGGAYRALDSWQQLPDEDEPSGGTPG